MPNANLSPPPAAEPATESVRPRTRAADETAALKLALPKGRLADGVEALLADAGVRLQRSERGYRPRVSLERVETKILKPQNVVEMVSLGTRDVGFAGADWIAELDADVVEVLDTGLAPVRVVAAAPPGLVAGAAELGRPLVVASEYERLTRAWIERRGFEARFVRSYGATEVFPPEDADIIVDNTSTGSTLRANGLEIVDELLTSSTRLIASVRAWNDPDRRRRIDDLALLLRAVLDARQRVMLEVNVAPDRLDAVVEALPCMRQPTVSALAASAGFAVKAAVPRAALADLLPVLKERGGTDIVVTPVEWILP
ncbi:MAG: ATP phosphoribosyltransferase [Planctomycetota bacterium]